MGGIELIFGLFNPQRMAATKIKFETVDQYIASFPKDVQQVLEKIRSTIKQAAPETEEIIHYQIPAYKQKKVFIYFSVFKDHYSIFIPQPGKVFEALKNDLEPYYINKANIQFPLDKPFPLELLTRLTKLKLDEIA